MHASLIAAAFAVGVLAVPFVERRDDSPAAYGAPPPPPSYGGDVYTDIEVVYVTDIVTVTADANAPAITPPNKHHAHKHKQPITTTTSEPPPQPVYTPEPAPEPQPAPEPEPQPQPAPEPEPQPEPAPETPAEVSPVAPEAPPAAPADNSGGLAPPASGSYQDTCTYHHNLHRVNHSVPLLTWSQDLADTARIIAESCVYAHNVNVNGGGYGQNMAAGVPADNISAVITDLFYNNEQPLYTWYGEPDPSMDMFDLVGHYTQMVWKSTTTVGCYTADCSATGLANTGSGVSPHFTICNYQSPGNYAGEYAENVLPPSSEPMANWESGLSAFLGTLLGGHRRVKL